VGHDSEAFIGVDTAKLRNAVAVAETGRRGRGNRVKKFVTNG
jgi:hypothetical protein